jgi:hypothetical protein
MKSRRLQAAGFLRIADEDLEYRMIGPAPDKAPSIVMLHEGLGCAALWGDFPEKLGEATGAGVFVYSRGLWRVLAGKAAPSARLHASRGARGFAEAAQ